MSNVLAISYDDQVPITASDSVDDPAGPFAGFYSGAGGTIKYTNIKGRNVTLANVVPGVIYPFPCNRIWSTTTTATGVHGCIALPYKRTAGTT